MTTRMNELDPCEKRELPDRPNPDAPSVNPAEPRSVVLPTAAFPSRDLEPIEQSTLREVSVIETNLFLPRELRRPENFDSLRFPSEIDEFESWENHPSPSDTLRYVGLKISDFQGDPPTDLVFMNRSPLKQSNIAVFYETSTRSSRMIRPSDPITGELGTPFEKTELSLHFDKALFLQRYPVAALPRAFRALADFIGASDSMQRALASELTPNLMYSYIFPQNAPGLLRQTSHLDFNFKTKAAFFESESAQALVPVNNSVDIVSSVGSLPLVAEARGEQTMHSLYRMYNDHTTGVEDTQVSLSSDKVQKFGSRVGLVNNVTLWATVRELGSSFFIKAEGALNTHTRIKFDTYHSDETAFAQALSSLGVVDLFLDYISSSPREDTKNRFVQVLDQKLGGIAANNRIEYRFEPRVHNITKFLSDVTGNLDRTMEILESLSKQHPLAYDEDRRQNIIDSIELGELETELVSYQYQNKRSFSDIYTGKLCKSEPVAYRIEKLDTDLKIIQEFYFFNDPEIDYLDFIDTQIGYDKTYTYRIYQINVVVGNLYRYANTQVSLSDFKLTETETELRCDFDVYNEPEVHVIETPYFEQSISIVDRPPMFPQVDVVPFFQNSDRIGFRLTPTYGSVVELPVKILQSDEQIIQKMQNNSPRLPDEQEVSSRPVHYAGDSQPTKYQVLIMDQEPSSYSDFSVANVIDIEARSGSGYIELELESNKLYYITFRAIDLQGISNPSAVYTLQLNSHVDGVFVQFDQYDMRPRDLVEPITFERVIKVDPSPEQIFVDYSQHMMNDNFYESAPLVTELSLGASSDSIWEKSYKLRLTSRTTGKSIDLNMSCEYKILEPLVDQTDMESQESDSTATPSEIDWSTPTDQSSDNGDPDFNFPIYGDGPPIVRTEQEEDDSNTYDDEGGQRSRAPGIPETPYQRREREERERRERERMEAMQREAERTAGMRSAIQGAVYNYEN